MVHAVDVDEGGVSDEVVARIPPIVDLDAHVVEPPDVWSSRLPRPLPRDRAPHRAPAGRCPQARRVRLCGGARDRRSRRRLVVLRGPPGLAEAHDRRGRVSTRRDRAARRPLRRDATRVLARPRAARGHGHQRGAGPVVLSELPPVLRPAVPLGQGPGAGPPVRRGLQRLDGRGVVRGGRRPAASPVSRPVVGRRSGGGGGRHATPTRGVRAVAFTELPPYLDLPSLYSGYWDPFLAACEETRTVVCMHIGSGTKTPQASPDGPDAVAATILFGNSVASLADLLFSGRCTVSRICACCTPRRRSAGSPTSWSGPTTSGRPTGAGATRNVTARSPRPATTHGGTSCSCFFKDPVGVALLDQVGVDNVVFETDYPHSDSTWPDSRRAAAEQFGHLDPESIRKIARQNAIDLLGLTLRGGVAQAGGPGRPAATRTAGQVSPHGRRRWPTPFRASPRPSVAARTRPRPPRASRASR